MILLVDEVLQTIRTSQFNVETENLLANHPYVKDAETGKLTSCQLKRFISEQYYIQQLDLKSLQRMADRSREEGKMACYKFFKMLTDGEKCAKGLIDNMTKWLDLTDNDLKEYSCSMKAQCYPSYLARCSMYETPAYVAIACAVNFPAWGRMCGRFHDALLKSTNIFGEVLEKDIEFLQFFATPIEGFDEMAVNCLREEYTDENFNLETLKTVVRLLQEAEVLFWDSVYGA